MRKISLGATGNGRDGRYVNAHAFIERIDRIAGAEAVSEVGDGNYIRDAADDVGRVDNVRGGNVGGIGVGCERCFNVQRERLRYLEGIAGAAGWVGYHVNGTGSADT